MEFALLGKSSVSLFAIKNTCAILHTMALSEDNLTGQKAAAFQDEDGGLPVWHVLAFACYLAWASVSIVAVDSPLHYPHTLPVCLGYLVGLVCGLAASARSNAPSSTRAAILLGIVGAIANGIALANPPALVQAALLAVASAACGAALFYWSQLFATIHKDRIAALVALGGLGCSLIMAIPMLGDKACAITLAVVPLLFAVFASIAQRAEEPGMRSGVVRDTRHTAWPLPCAILA